MDFYARCVGHVDLCGLWGERPKIGRGNGAEEERRALFFMYASFMKRRSRHCQKQGFDK